MPDEFTMGPPAETEQPWEQQFSSPWDADYGPLPTVTRGRMRAADPAELEEAEDDEGWAIVPQARGPDSGALGGGSHSAARNRGPMVPLEQISSLPVWQTGHLSAITPAVWARHIIRNVNTTVFNLVLISLLVGILGIPVYIGWQHLQQIQPIPKSVPTVPAKVEPTAAVPTGFTPFQAAHFSLAYPSDWSHTSRPPDSLNGGYVLQGEDFKGTGNNDEVLVGTTTSVASDHLQGFLSDLAQHQFSQGTMQPVAAPNRHVTYDHEQWLEDDYAVTLLQGNKNITLEAHVLVANHGTTTFYVIVIATRSAFAAESAKYGNPLLASFRFQG